MPLGLYTPFMEDVGAVYLPAVVPAVLSAGVTMVLLAKQITRLLERHYSVVFHGSSGLLLAATLVIVPVFCVWKSENVGSEPALPDGRRRDCAAVFHARGKCNERRCGAAASFFMYRKRSVRRMLTEDGRCAALWKTGMSKEKFIHFLIFNSRLVYCILGGMQ